MFVACSGCLKKDVFLSMPFSLSNFRSSRRVGIAPRIVTWRMVGLILDDDSLFLT